MANLEYDGGQCGEAGRGDGGLGLLAEPAGETGDGEPEPGRVLQESDLDKPGEFTRFIFQPLPDGAYTRVTIATEFLASPGLTGVMERLTKPGLVRKMYQQELRNLAEYVHTH